MSGEQRYRDRRAAGKILGSLLRERVGSAHESVVLALPRGGVPVGFEVARALEAPLDVFVVRKLGMPGQPELAMGAIASGGFEVLNESLIAELGITDREIAAIAHHEEAELGRREALYRANREPLEVQGRVSILVDDGLATGFTMRAAIAAVRQRAAGQLIVAVPVGAEETCAELAAEVDAIVCPLQPEHLHAVGFWYDDFSPTSDDEVQECLATAMKEHAAHLRR